jgi:hypothetical protein
LFPGAVSRDGYPDRTLARALEADYPTLRDIAARLDARRDQSARRTRSF